MLNEAGVTEQQWRVLRALLGDGPLEPRHIVEICCLSSASLVGILARMEDLGLVTRERMEGDQRRVLVSVSAKGQRLADRLAPRIESIYSQLESDIGLDIAETLYETLDAMSARLGGSQ
jgi:homoprotocatechuate degradation regulator HpaR